MDGNRKYSFYGWETADVRAESPAFSFAGTPRDPTWGQCSVTSFLVQDIFGGKVYGVPLPEGGVHCYNDVNGCVFDLTSGQFGDTKLCYEGNAEQSREKHFSDPDKYARYCLLKEKLSAGAMEKNESGE